MSRHLVAGAGMAAIADAMLGSDLIGGFPTPRRPGDGHKRAQARLLAQTTSSNYVPGDEPLPETRQQRRARERREAKRGGQP